MKRTYLTEVEDAKFELTPTKDGVTFAVDKPNPARHDSFYTKMTAAEAHGLAMVLGEAAEAVVEMNRNPMQAVRENLDEISRLMYVFRGTGEDAAMAIGKIQDRLKIIEDLTRKTE